MILLEVSWERKIYGGIKPYSIFEKVLLLSGGAKTMSNTGNAKIWFYLYNNVLEYMNYYEIGI